MTPHPAEDDHTAVEVDSLDFCYGSKQSLFNVTMKVPRNRVTAFIGPSGCGKSTLLLDAESCSSNGASCASGRMVSQKQGSLATPGL